MEAYRQSPSGAHILMIAVFTMLVGLSGLMTVPPLDRDESRFIQATTQMIETGDYLRIRYQDEERNKKPVGIYWLQSASVQVLADVEDRPLWAYRLPSLIAVILAAVFTYVAGARLFGRSAGFLAAMLLAAAPVVAGEASIAKTDATLLASICAMQAALVRVLTAKAGETTRSAALSFWIAMGIGILVKGPIAPMVGAFTVAGVVVWKIRTAAELNLRQSLRPLLGVAILIGMVVPWAVAIGIVTEGRFFTEAIGTDMLGKVTQGQERHGGPPGYHLVALWMMFWPAALFIPVAVRHAVPNWRSGGVALCLAWIIPGWLVFEITATKLAHYTMVLYPALALLIGHLVVSVPSDKYRGMRWLGVFLYVLVTGIAAALILFLAHTYSVDGINGWHIFACVIIAGSGLSAAILSLRRATISALTVAVLASGIFAWVAFEGVLPTLDRLALTPRLASMLDRNEAHPLRDDTGPVALVGYHEPSAVFTLGTATQLLTAKEAAVWIISADRRAVVVEDRQFTAFMEALPDGVAVEAIETIEGFNYSNSKDMRLTLYRVR